MLVELKNGETLNGHLVTCDTWMNLTLKEVVQTSPVSVLLQGGFVNEGR
jgi:U6 snRNA-associated Sm-like protein LSm4